MLLRGIVQCIATDSDVIVSSRARLQATPATKSSIQAGQINSGKPSDHNHMLDVTLVSWAYG